MLLAAGAILYFDDDVATAIGPSCTVGVAGTAATLTVRGWQSGKVCDALDLGSTYSLYRVSGELRTATICEYRIGHARYIVKDEGTLKLVGNITCVALRAEPGSAIQTY